MNGGSLGVHGFLYTQAEGLVDLTPDSDTGYALDINDAGQVTGYKTALGGYHAFRWQGGTFVDLGVLPGDAHSFGWAINASGQVTGSSTSGSGNSERSSWPLMTSTTPNRSSVMRSTKSITVP